MCTGYEARNEKGWTELKVITTRSIAAFKILAFLLMTIALLKVLSSLLVSTKLTELKLKAKSYVS